jgi:hypothetical protein
MTDHGGLRFPHVQKCVVPTFSCKEQTNADGCSTVPRGLTVSLRNEL